MRRQRETTGMSGKDKRELLHLCFDMATTWSVEMYLAVACHESWLLMSGMAEDKRGRLFGI